MGIQFTFKEHVTIENRKKLEAVKKLQSSDFNMTLNMGLAFFQPLQV
jgi:hypothetical protein